MSQAPGGGTYLCPMHPEVRRQAPGKCPRCAMALVPEGTSFGMLRHLANNPWMLMIMAACMVGIMVAVMAFVLM